MEIKYWVVDLTSDHYSSNVTMSRIDGETSKDAEREALRRMADQNLWRVVGTDRC